MKSRTSKYITLCIFLTSVLCLTGCGQRQDIVYNTETDHISTEKNATNENVVSLQDSLGITDLRWDESVSVPSGEVTIRTSVLLPDTNEIYTMTATKASLTTEKKKEILNYFVDIDTVQVDVESIQTKEDIEETIKQLENDAIEHNVPKPDDIIAWYREQMDDAPLESELSYDVGDFSAEKYIGTKDNISFSFYLCEKDSTGNLYIDVAREDSDSMNICYSDNHSPGNRCQKTEEQACEEALKICNDLGLPSMKILHSEDLYRIKFASEANERDEQWVEGYYIVLSRNIGDVAADLTYYYSEEDLWQSYARNYNQEKIEICIDDKGVLSLVITGLLTEGTLNGKSTLLSFDKIQDIIKQELTENNNAGDLFTSLSLQYLRIINPDNSDEFCFIPAWRMCKGRNFELYYAQPIDNVILINAIDGSIIDIGKVGLTETSLMQ